MRQNYNSFNNFGSEFVQLFISFLNLFIEGLIFNFELFKIDEMETISKLLLLFQDLLLVRKSISQSDVLETILMDLLVFQ